MTRRRAQRKRSRSLAAAQSGRDHECQMTRGNRLRRDDCAGERAVRRPTDWWECSVKMCLRAQGEADPILPERDAGQAVKATAGSASCLRHSRAAADNHDPCKVLSLLRTCEVVKSAGLPTGSNQLRNLETGGRGTGRCRCAWISGSSWPTSVREEVSR